MVVNIIIEGILPGALLVLFCAAGIRNGAVNMKIWSACRLVKNKSTECRR